ncbi:insulinase family protein [Glaciecola sp. XM2]|uniref:insulinase family protein n=1 Tax=Glaciecola sp. XM2 TaxID=1914931 RepID=UPI001BDEBB42|nr:insulinase family protein [Glaciecola sp. XM2]
MYLPKSTERKLEVETLSNQLQLALIRSQSTTQPIISISVALGHYHETDQCYGFSHLLEHMIFNRSKHYDDPNRLEHWVSKHGGYINGWTHSAHTNFHLSCSSNGFLKAVKMLCDKVAHPSFTQSDITSEINAIEEEFQLKKNDPIRSLFSVKKALVNPLHPFHRFTVGNLATLSELDLDVLQQALHMHHKTYFHTGNIAVAISLPQEGDFDELIEEVKKVLSSVIVTGNAKPKAPTVPLYDEHIKGKWIDIQTLQKHHQLILCWQVKKHTEQVDTSALLMLRKLIESKHQGGLFETLADKNYIHSLSFTGGIEQSDYEEIQLHMSLTAQGMAAKDEVLSILAQFMEFLEQSQIATWRFQEQERQQNLMNQYASREDAVEACIQSAQALHTPNSEQQPRLSVNQVKQRISDIISQLQWPAQHVYCLSDHDDLAKRSPFYQTPYQVCEIQPFARAEHPNFILAPQNPYLPSQLLKVSAELPGDQLLESEQHGVLMKFLQRCDEEQPSGDCFISINSPGMSDDITKTMSKKLWIEGLSRFLKRKFYSAEEAGVSYRVYGHQHGLTLHTTGVSERQLLLCIEIINCIIKFSLSEDEFEQAKRSCAKRLSNSLLQKPINQLFAQLNTLVQRDTYDIAEQVKAIESLEFDQANEHQMHFFDNVFVEALVVGNWRKYAAQRLQQQLQARLTAKRVWKKPAIQANAFARPTMGQITSVQQEETAFVFYQQVDKLSDDFLYTREHATAVCLVLEHILSPHMFVALRKQKQLAYLVGVGFKPINMQPGIAIYLQSSKASANEIYLALKEVINGLLFDWEETLEEIEQSKQEVAKQCIPHDRDIAGLARRLWANFDRNDPVYNYVTQQKAIYNVDDNELKKWFVRLSQASPGQLILTNDGAAILEDTFKPFVKH